MGMFSIVVFFCIAYLSYEAYFSLGEGVIMGLSCVLGFRYLWRWYIGATRSTEFFAANVRGVILYCLPLVTVFMYLLTLRTVASYDVVDNGKYVFMYLMFGITWLYLSLVGMFLCMDFSYQDDVLAGNHTAPLVTCVCACLAISLIYAGANVGDGPGWWTVVFAGGLGTVTWLLLGGLVGKTTRLVEQVVMDKEVGSSIRLGGYLLAMGIILARASSGDWTSFGMTVVEFLVGWPVLPLTAVVIVHERLVFADRDRLDARGSEQAKSVVAALLYLLIALVAVGKPMLGFFMSYF